MVSLCRFNNNEYGPHHQVRLRFLKHAQLNNFKKGRDLGLEFSHRNAALACCLDLTFDKEHFGHPVFWI